MPQNNGRSSFGASEQFVSDFDYSEARTILDLTINKQKRLRRQRSQALYTQILLKRTYVHVCDLLDSDCSPRKQMPLSLIDTNKRRTPFDDDESKSVSKKSKTSIEHSTDLANDNDILQFLLELNAVKVMPRY
jgi:hypothetical protein